MSDPLRGWKTVKLSDVCRIDKKQDDHTDLPYVGMEHIESNTGRFIGSLEHQTVKSKTFRFGPEHVLYGRLRPYLNKVIAPDFNGHCATEIFPLLPSESLLREYLHYWFMQDATVQAIDATCTGARMPRANMKEVMGFEIPLPPLSEQRRLVGLLDAAFAGLATATAHTQKNLQNARELFEILLANVFINNEYQWHLDDLGNHIDLQSGFAFKSREYVESGHFLIRISNVQSGKLELKNQKFVQLDQSTARFELSEGDLLTSLTGNIGRVAKVEKQHLPAALNQRVARITPKVRGPLREAYLFLYLQSDAFRNGLSKGGHGAAQQNVSPKEIGRLKIPIPPDEPAQGDAVDRLESVRARSEDAGELATRKLAALEELKRSILQRAIRGELSGDAAVAAATREAEAVA